MMKTLEQLDHELHRLLAEREALAAAEAAQEREPEAPAETDEEFLARYGGEACRVGRNVLSKAGALLDAAGRRHPPALEPWAVASRLRSLRRLAVEQLHQSERDFARLKASGRDGSLTWGATFTERYGEAPQQRDRLGRPCAVAALDRIRDVVHRHRAALAELDRRIADLPEERDRRAMLEAERRTAGVGAEVQAEVDAITL